MSEPKKMKCLKVQMVGRGEVLIAMAPPLTKDKKREMVGREEKLIEMVKVSGSISSLL